MSNLFHWKRGSRFPSKGKQPASPSPTIPRPSVTQLGSLSLTDLSDRQETTQRFLKASKLLGEALDKCRIDGMGKIDFPELSGEPDQFDLRFREKINNFLESRREAAKDKSAFAKAGDIINGLYTAVSPFAKNFLSVAIQGQSVFVDIFALLNSRSLC
jgi:hypothetical protein